MSGTPVVFVGAAGFIGRRALVQLARSGRPVVAIGLRPFALEESLADRVTVAVAPDGDFGRVLPATTAFTLVHCAWCPPRRDVWAPHAEQVALLAKALDAGGDRIDRLVGLGSAEEYGAKSGRLQENEAAEEMLSPYAWGKRSARLLVKSWSEKLQRSALWLRPFTVYGEGQAGNMVTAYAVRQAIAREPAKFSDAKQRRDFIHVDDVARGIAAAAGAEMGGYREVNLGTGVSTPVCDFLGRLARRFEAEALFEFGALPRRPNEPEEQRADTTQASALLHWNSAIDIEAGLDRIYQHARH